MRPAGGVANNTGRRAVFSFRRAARLTFLLGDNVAFTEKLLSFQFTLAQGSFQGGGNSLTVEGLRATAKIIKSGGADMSTLEASIYGMTLSQMNQLTLVGINITQVGKNTIIVQAGDAETGMSTVFQGTITSAWMDGTTMPEVPFRVQANAALFEAVTPQTPTSVQGQADVAQMMSKIAQTLGLNFENNSVSAKLANPYFFGTGRTQALAIAQAAGIEWIIDNGTLAIWPPGQSRQGAATTVSKDTIMVGYPGFNQMGIVVKVLWVNTLEYGMTIQVQSDITPACGTWVIYSMDYDLSSQLPHGPWFCTLSACQTGQSQMVS
jgi:hypothetical protein